MTGFRTAASIAKDFFRENRKSILSFSAVFAVGILLGVFITINVAGGEFERVARADIEFGAVKVFFTSAFMTLAGYGVLLLAACAPALALVSLLSFGVLGYYFGKYVCLLVAVYGMTGIINMLVIYLPFFLLTFLCMCVAGARAARAVGCARVKNSALLLLKIYGVNIAINFLLFIVLGAFTKVIVVGF